MLNNKYIRIGIGAIIVITAILFIINDFYSDKTPFENDDILLATTTTSLGNTVAIQGTGNYEIKQIPIDNGIGQGLVYPNLDRALVFPDSFPETARAIVLSNTATLITNLREDPNSFKDWLNLAMQYKIIEDYEGARGIWEFLSVASPQNSVSFRNLGDLYSYYLNDKQKAEENFLKAIEISPNETEYYMKTMEFYRDVAKDIIKARQIIERGIQANPNSEELKSSLNNLNLQ